MIDPLAVLLAETEARVNSRLQSQKNHTESAIAAYVDIETKHSEMRDVAAEALMTPLITILTDAAETRRSMRNDPAEPGLEGRHSFVLHELSSLAAFAIGRPEYVALCAEITELMNARAAVEPTWKLLRPAAAAVPQTHTTRNNPPSQLKQKTVAPAPAATQRQAPTSTVSTPATQRQAPASTVSTPAIQRQAPTRKAVPPPTRKTVPTPKTAVTECQADDAEYYI